MSASPWPTEIHVNRAKATVSVAFDNGERFELPAEYLRVESPSAEVQGHGAAKPPPVAGKSGVSVRAAEPVGNYAVRFIFDDGHDTGLYSWDLLYRLGRDRSARWASYLARLSEFGLARSAGAR